MTHLVWDWNGTLLDDTDAALSALNGMLEARSLAPITRERYRRHFSFPVRPFYASLGIRLEDENWDALALEYHERYEAEPKTLHADAVAALRRAADDGARQHLVSALREDKLLRATVGFAVRPFFDRVVGTDNLDGSSKLERARDLVAELRRASPAADFVFIGDALHDADVAADVGARCVLFSGGSHSAERLALRAPVGRTLEEAVALALE